MDKKRIKTALLIHEIKNLLAVIEAGINSLVHQSGKFGLLTEKQIKILNRVLRYPKVAKGLVNDILEIDGSAEGIIKRKKCILHSIIILTLVDIIDLTDHNAGEVIGKSQNVAELKTYLSAKGILLNIKENLWMRELVLD